MCSNAYFDEFQLLLAETFVFQIYVGTYERKPADFEIKSKFRHSLGFASTLFYITENKMKIMYVTQLIQLDNRQKASHIGIWFQTATKPMG